MAKDYVYAVTPLLEDALIDRDQVHRQTAASVVKHVALGVVGLGCEDAMLHLLSRSSLCSFPTFTFLLESFFSDSSCHVTITLERDS